MASYRFKGIKRFFRTYNFNGFDEKPSLVYDWKKNKHFLTFVFGK